MKEILMSIRPEWGKKIFNGEKTIEVRKTRPLIDMPFKVIVYETKGQFIKSVKGACTTYGYGRGKVIGSFVCDRIVDIKINGDDCGNYWHEWSDECDIEDMYLSYEELEIYLGKSVGYGWHITEPKLFDKPRELCEFCVPCKEYDSDKPHCGECDYYSYSPNDSGDAQEECLCNGSKPIRRPPVSWCYIEGGNRE